ncbi:hypothetical protein HYT52_00345 [Candidatus Woesearchaeota archaeon]|nr:hypothetical protein [Candidatus Woesearchaeota archaeon]
MPSAEYTAPSYDDLLAFVVRSMRRSVNYQLSTSISPETTNSARQIVRYTKAYEFLVDGKVQGVYRQEGLSYENGDRLYIDNQQSLTDFIEDVAELSSPRTLEFGVGDTGRFFVKTDIIIPQRGTNPLHQRGDLKGWLREYFQSNGKQVPNNFSSLRLEDLTTIYETESARYGFSISDIVVTVRK